MLGNGGKTLLTSAFDDRGGDSVCDMAGMVVPNVSVARFSSKNLEVVDMDADDDVSLNSLTSLNVTCCEERFVEGLGLGIRRPLLRFLMDRGGQRGEALNVSRNGDI